jgi:Copper chaperone
MTKKILIEGMSCGHCVNHVKEALSELAGVNKVDVNLATKSAVIETASEVADADIKFAVEDAGYDVVNISVL